MDKFIDKIYEEYFSSYYKIEFDTIGVNGAINFKDEVKSVLSSAYEDLERLSNSKINITQYEREIQRLYRNANELQKYSTKKIHLDQLPKQPYEILSEMRSYLTSTYKLEKNLIEEAFKEMYNNFFKVKIMRNLKKTKRVKEYEKALITLFANFYKENSEWIEHFKNNKEKPYTQIRDTFKP